MKQVFFFLLLPFLGMTQLTDNFSDSSLSEWSGDQDKFFINTEEQLQLNDTSRISPASLFRDFSMQGSTVWELYIQLNFSPSSSNFAKIILWSNQMNTENFQGYFLKIGGISGSEDAVELFRQDGSEDELLLSGTSAAVADDPVIVRVKVVRDETGFWTLLADYNGGSDFVEEGSVLDDRYTSGQFFGIECRYTATRSDQFFFDDLKIETQQDETAPKLLSAEAISANRILLTFDEPIANNTAVSEVNNYQITPNSTIVNAFLEDEKTVLLTVDPSLQNATNYTITVQNISDLVGNVIQNTSASFQYTELEQAVFGDIIINEIMADPNPSIGLPEAEYLELYNRSDKSINLEGFVLADLTQEVVLPNYILLPEAYVLLYEKEVSEFEILDNALGLENLVSLGNTSDQLQLIAPNGTLIDLVNYTDDWYKNSEKDDGGWSLELINPSAVCDASANNWQASENGTGGTPGSENSVLNEFPDDNFSGIQRITVLDDQTIQLFFAENVSNVALEFSNYEIEGTAVVNASFASSDFTSIILELDRALEKSQIYTLTLDTNFSDCLGNTNNAISSATFALPDEAENMDIIINEILFNPETGGSDFVELYNRSDKIIDVQSLILSDANLDNVERVGSSYLLFPNEYVVFTESRQDILNRYTVQNQNALIETNLPSLDDKSGSIAVYRTRNLQEIVVLDQFEYSSDFHSALLDDENGVSLERLNPNAPTQDGNNWHSAAASVGFATPTAQNSQFFESSVSLNSAFQLTENTISPDGDGFQDILLLEYQVDQVGYLANVQIFDAEGRKVTDLSRGELIATEGVFKWDGTIEDGRKARMGIYIIAIEYFDPNGTTRQEQFTFVVAGRLD